jgi:hypothetical protein
MVGLFLVKKPDGTIPGYEPHEHGDEPAGGGHEHGEESAGGGHEH